MEVRSINGVFAPFPFPFSTYLFPSLFRFTIPHSLFPSPRLSCHRLPAAPQGSCRQDICGIHLTLPCSYLQEDKVRSNPQTRFGLTAEDPQRPIQVLKCFDALQVQLTAILIAHSGAEKDSNSKLHTELAVSLASHGHAVVRCQCSGSKDSQDHSAKTAIAAFMTSPYAVSIQRWFFIGGLTLTPLDLPSAAVLFRKGRGTLSPQTHLPAGFSTAGQTLCRIFSSVDPPITGLILLSCLPQVRPPDKLTLHPLFSLLAWPADSRTSFSGHGECSKGSEACWEDAGSAGADGAGGRGRGISGR